MKIQVEQNESCEALVTVEVDSATVDSSMKRAARRISEKRDLPGFRKGKAPFSVVMSSFGEEVILDEALETLGPEVYRQVLDEQHLEPSAVGTMKRIVSRSPLTLEFLVPMKPLIQTGEYRSVRLPFEEPAITEEEVERSLDQIRQSQSIVEPVQRAAQNGDVLVADVQMQVIRESGEKEPLKLEGEENPQELDLNENLGGRFPGAGPSLTGILPEETRTLTIQYPDSFPVVRLRSLKVFLTITCREVKVRRVPEWSEDLVKTVSEYGTLEELRGHVRSRLETQARESREEEYADRVIDTMVEGAEIKYPQALLEEEIDAEIETLSRRLVQRKTSLEVYLRTIPDGLSGLRKQLDPEARRKLARQLFLSEFVKQEGLEPVPADIEAQLQVYRSLYPESRKGSSAKRESVEGTLRQLATNDVLTRLLVKRVVQIGKGQASEPAAKPSQTVS
jgi:trigger factor